MQWIMMEIICFLFHMVVGNIVHLQVFTWNDAYLYLSQISRKERTVICVSHSIIGRHRNINDT